MTDSFVWIGPVSGVWSAAANWNDITLGAVATAPPGAADTASFASPANLFQVIAGTGAAANLSLTGKNDVVGSLAIGVLSVGTTLLPGTLRVNSGGSMTVASATIAQSSSALVVGGTLAISGSVADGPQIAVSAAGTLTVGGTLGSGASAVGGSRVQAASVNILNGGGFVWDATSSVEIGTLGGAAAGTMTVDAGATLDFNIYTTIGSRGATLAYGATLVDNGLIRINGIFPAYLTTGTVSGGGSVVVSDGAILSATGVATGGVGFQIGKAAVLAIGKAAAANSVAFAGSNGVLALGNPATYDMQAAITGFDATDVFTFDRLVNAASYAAGVLTVSNGGTTVATLKLGAGYSASSFKVIQTGTASSEIFLAGTAAAGPSAGAGGDAYRFSGAVSGDWNTAANWTDTTLGGVAAVAPGAGDSVTFQSGASFNQVISGVGNSAALTLIGNNQVTGTLATGALTLGVARVAGLAGNYGTGLRIDNGARVSASSVTFGSGSALTIFGGTLAVSGSVGAGSIVIDHGTLTATGTLGGIGVLPSLNHASRVQVGSGSLGYYMDALSSVEVGTLGTVVAGSVVVDAGATAITGHYMVGSGNVVNNGTIMTGGTNDGATLSALSHDGTISGSGTILVGDNASTSTTNSVVAAASLKFGLGKNAVLWLSSVGVGNSIAFNASGGLLNLYETASYSGVYNMKASISGFDASDALTISHAVTAATLSAGVLTLTNGATTVASLNLAGSYTGRSFIAVPTSGTTSQIVLSAPAVAGPSAGTAGGEAFLYSGPVSGDWNNIGNWTDSTIAGPAVVAPGSLDAVTIIAPTTLYQVISGTGNAASLTLRGGFIDVIGKLTVGSVVATTTLVNGHISGIAANLRIGAGGNIAAGSVTNDLGAISIAGGTLAVSGDFSQGYYTVPVDSGVLTVGGTLAAGASVSNHARVQAAAVSAHDYGFVLDATSSIEIGTAGGIATGALVVDAGASFAYSTTAGTNTQNYLLVGPTLIDNGTINVSGSNLARLIANNGTVVPTASGAGRVIVQAGAKLDTTGGSIAAGSLSLEIGANASLTLDKVAAGNSVSFTGAHGALTLSTPLAYSVALNKFVQTYGMNATVNGFDGTDAISITSAVTNASLSGGVLTLGNGATTVATLTLAGDYSGKTFLAIPTGTSPTTSTPTSQVSLFNGSVFVAGTTITVGAQAGNTASLDLLFADTNLVTNHTIVTLVLNGPGTASLSGAVTIDNFEIAGGGTFLLNGAAVTTDPVTVDSGGNVSGYGTLTGAIADGGTITASGGTLVLTDAISGAGALVIAAAGTLKLNAAVGAGVGLTFGGVGAKLILGASASLAGAITGFGGGESIVIPAATGADASIVVNGGTTTLSLSKAGASVGTLSFAGSLNGLGFDPASGTVTACYAEGSRILTCAGEVAVERLAVGDLVPTLGGGAGLRRIVWIGRSPVALDRHPDPARAAPIRVQAGAFGTGMPHRDLRLSPEHAVHVDGVLVPIHLLVNGASIAREVACRAVTYFHIELDRHSVLLAEGLACESYLDTGNRAAFANVEGPRALHPDFAAREALDIWATAACAPLLLAGERLVALHARLLARATAIGHVRGGDPCMTLEADGAAIPLAAGTGGMWHARLPAGARRLRLRSRSSLPRDGDASRTDRRRLGVPLLGLALDGVPVALDDTTCAAGFFPADGEAWRWTDGCATLLLPDHHGATLTLRVGSWLSYWQEAA